MSLIHICHVYKCRNQELKKKELTLPPLHSSSQWGKYLHTVYLWIQTICSVENMNRWVFHMHRDRMPVWCTCDHTRALMSSDLYMSIRISSESPLKIAWMRGGCGDEKEQSRDHYGRYTKGYDPSHGMKCCLCVQYLKLQRVQKLQTVHKRNASLPLLLISPVSLWDRETTVENFW